MFGVGGVGRKMRTWPRFEKKDTQSSTRTTVSHPPPPPPQSLKPDDGLPSWRRQAVMALLWARRRAILGGFFARLAEGGEKRKMVEIGLPFSRWQAFVLCRVRRWSLGYYGRWRRWRECRPPVSLTVPITPPPPIPTPPAINRNNRIQVGLCVKAPASSRPLKIVFFKIVDGLSEICAQANHQSVVKTPHCVGKKMQRNWSNYRKV